jgi:asparagine synthase (glutamine-hydrolysing)
MPGLLGIVSNQGEVVTGHAFPAMLKAMSRGGRLRAESWIDPRCRSAIGRVHLGVLQADPQLVNESSVQVVFHGDLDNERELHATLRQLGASPVSGAAATVGALYRLKGTRVASELKGAFCAAIIDTTTDDVVLITDRLGCYPLYWFQLGDRFVFASELRAALRAHPRPSLNPQAVADLLKFAFPMGDKTLAAGVDLVPAASIVVYHGSTGKVTIESYASLADLFKPSGIGEADYFESVKAAFSQSMERATAGNHRYGLSLSGGLDTRVMLSALDRLKCPLSTFTLGGRGCADEVIANELSRMAGTKHRFVALDNHYLDDLYSTVDRMVALTDGMYVSHGFTEMLALQGFEESDCTVLLRGHAGELAKASTAWPLHTDSRIHAMTSAREFIPYMLARLTHVSRGNAARAVFTEEWAQALDGADPQTSLESAIRGVDLPPADLCSFLYLKEYHRRVTVPSLEIFRNVTEVRMPFADVDFLRAVLQGPARWRDGVRIHQTLIATNSKKYLRVRNPNTGAPAGAGPLREAIFDKINSALRRLNVYGYRHYHSFDGWMRQTLLELVDRVLLDRETLSRGVFRETALHDLVARARESGDRQGATHHDDLLQALVTIELWQRQAA